MNTPPYRQENILELELPYHEKMVLKRSVFRGGSGPRVAVVSGIHGDELEGLYVCHRLAVWLEALLKNSPQSFLGEVDLYPALNPLGIDTIQRFVPVFETDLNRNFPGEEKGLFPKRMAHAIMKSLKDCALVVDIHASNIYLREVPQVRINQEFSSSLVSIAQNMNIDIIWLHGAVTVLEATIAHSLNSLKIPCLVVEMGVGMRISPDYTEQLMIGLLHVWKKLGVFSPDLELPPLTHHPLIANDYNVHYLNASTSGLFIPTVEHWSTLKKNDLLGQIVSPHQGKILAEVRSPTDGVLFTLREYPIVYEGSLMARIMAIEPFCMNG